VVKALASHSAARDDATMAELDPKRRLTDAARAAGFDAVRVTRPDAIPRAAGRLAAFLTAGQHAGMAWLATTAARRGDPRVLWPQARSVVMLGVSYAPACDPIATAQPADRAVISAYARGRDYHDVVKSGLKRVAREFAATTGAEVKVFVDTAPLMEKPLAEAAGIGWQGKHTNLVSREHGSWLFLGAILTTADLDPDAPEVDHCGSCRRCLDVCPTDAFPAPYQLDARRCIAYLTIEHKGPIPQAFRRPIGNRVFGCDDCLAVCPWNKFAVVAREARFHARVKTDNPPIAELLALDDGQFRQRFAGTPVKRTGRDRVVRNALIAAGNAGEAVLRAAVEALLDDASPVVRGAAVWAYRQLEPEAARSSVLRRRLHAETDPDVRAEWTAPVGDAA
jgi:epoxyqueuosine reductase